MNKIESEIFDFLSHINANGNFVAFGNEEFILPGLTIKQFGELALPVTEIQAQNLIEIAHKAPFGKGSQTVLDTNVRSVWEIDAQELSFKNPQWDKWFQHLLNKVKEQLGLQHQNMIASLYKMLIYEKDDFFVWHKDSEKEKNMFATLVITLPAMHTGGELAVRFKEEEVLIDFSASADKYLFGYAAFYADCDHEVRPITSGYRVSLVYNLLQSTNTTKLSADEFTNQVAELSQLLKQWEGDFKDEPKAILLGHQYTPANFSLQNLKLDDMPRVQTLLKASEKAGFFARLALVTHYQSGELEYEYSPRKRRNYYDDEDETDGEMGEVYEEYTHIETWAEDNMPVLGTLTLDEDDIITDETIAADNPIEKEVEGYTGNAGMTIEYWYHYGAVVLWPKKLQRTILAELNLENSLDWLGYYVHHFDTEPIATEYIRLLLDNLEGVSLEDKWNCRELDASGFADAWVFLNDRQAFIKKSFLLVPLFDKIRFESLLKLIECYSSDLISPVFGEVANAQQMELSVHLIEFLVFLIDKNEQIPFLNSQIHQIPNYFADIKSYLAIPENPYYNVSVIGKHQFLVKQLIRRLLKIGGYNANDLTWATSISISLTADKKREYINDILAKVLLEETQYQQSPLFQKLLQICIEYLRERTVIKPKPLADWKRARPDTLYDKDVWDMLEGFLSSPNESEFRYQKIQADRSIVENAIRRVQIDLEMETVKKGSPHTLLIKKNQNAFNLTMKDWITDVQLLEDLLKSNK